MAIWNILRTFGIFYEHLVKFAFIWYIFPVLVSRTKKNLATLVSNLAPDPFVTASKSQLTMISPDGDVWSSPGT
jgi:hypothetical protein